MKRLMGVILLGSILAGGCDLDCWDDCDDSRSGYCDCNDRDCWDPGCICPGGWCGDPECRRDSDCSEGEHCDLGWCVDDPSDEPDLPDLPEHCASGQECPDGYVCHLNDECVAVVTQCPLTDECLGDPEGFVPEWMGIDPVFVGDATSATFRARVELHVDFYEDHLFGEARLLVEDLDDGDTELVEVIVTGSRSGAQLQGQILEQDVTPRTFDAIFSAQLLDAVAIVGTAVISSDEGTVAVDFTLFRTSPCGCTPCTVDTDCSADQECRSGQCVEACDQECCQNEDCVSGDHCVDSACQTPCVTRLDCDVCEDCIDGYCVLQ